MLPTQAAFLSSRLHTMRNSIIPVFWLNETANIDGDSRDELFNKVVLTQKAAYGGSYAALALGILILALVALFWLMVKLKRVRIIGPEGVFQLVKDGYTETDHPWAAVLQLKQPMGY